MAEWPRTIAYDLRHHMRLIVTQKGYVVERKDVIGALWVSKQRAPMEIGDEAAVRMLHRCIMADAEEHRRVYEQMAAAVQRQMEKQMLHGLSYGLGKPLPTSGHDDALRYYRGAQRGRDRLPQPVTAGSNRGAKA